MIEQVKARIRGVAPLIMHNGRLADPTDEWGKKIRKVSSTSNKTDSQHNLIADVEWRGALYEDAEGRVCIPGDNLLASMRKGMSEVSRRNSKKFQAGCWPSQDTFPLIYEPMKTIEEMMSDPRFRFSRMVAMASSRNAKVTRTRPIFNVWSADVSFDVNTSVIDEKIVREALVTAGEIVGIGDWRPRYGRFTVEFM